MPFKSKAQMRLFFAKEKKGELPKGTAETWVKHTHNIDSLPEKVASWVDAAIPAFTKLAEALRYAKPVPAAITLKQATEAAKAKKQKGMDGVQYRNYLTNSKRNLVARGSEAKKVS
jgi:hypothetical protein